MFKFFAIGLIALSSTAMTASAVQARGGRCYRAAAPSYVVAATAAAPTTGYRTYSYEPGTYVAPQARHSYGVPSGAPNPFRDAGGKIRGE